MKTIAFVLITALLAVACQGRQETTPMKLDELEEKISELRKQYQMDIHTTEFLLVNALAAGKTDPASQDEIKKMRTNLEKLDPRRVARAEFKAEQQRLGKPVSYASDMFWEMDERERTYVCSSIERQYSKTFEALRSICTNRGASR